MNPPEAATLLALHWNYESAFFFFFFSNFWKLGLDKVSGEKNGNHWNIDVLSQKTKKLSQDTDHLKI